VLWSSYPSAALHRSDFGVLSVFGSAEARTNPAGIEAHKSDLPPSTRYVEVPGGTDAFLCEYGDGTPDTRRSVAQQQVVTATTAFLATFQPPQAKKAAKK
jgi:hypothetical protein